MRNTEPSKPRKKKPVVEHGRNFPRHEVKFGTHPTKPPKDGDDPAN